jgi:Amt family ammonium transporter
MNTDLLTTNNVWMMICTALVFFMHLGFSLLEIGLTRQKNTLNILFKNIFIICSGLLLYSIVGFNLMYPGFEKDALGIFGFSGFGLDAPMVNGSLDLSYNAGYTYYTDFLFQGMFAATAATIVSGAVAERMKIGAFMIFSIIYVGFVYPLAGSWKWGGGFLQKLETPFYDFELYTCALRRRLGSSRRRVSFRSKDWKVQGRKTTGNPRSQRTTCDSWRAHFVVGLVWL